VDWPIHSNLVGGISHLTHLAVETETIMFIGLNRIFTHFMTLWSEKSV
jgi:hypothetical protein